MKIVRALFLAVLLAGITVGADVKPKPVVLGKVLRSVGTVKIARAGKEIVPKSNEIVYAGDKIITGKSSIAYVKFSNGKFVKLSANRYVDASDLSKQKIAYKWLKKIPQSKLSKDKFVQQMPVSTAGVRGAEKAKKSKLSEDYIWVESQEAISK